MLSLTEVIQVLQDKNYPLSESISSGRAVYYETSLHIDGINPVYKSLRTGLTEWNNKNTKEIRPNNWGCSEYQQLFNERLLNRHSREPEELRQYRLSQYRPRQKAAFIQAIQVITGALFQDSQYTIEVQNKADNEYIWGNNFNRKDLITWISDNFQNVCSDPNGYILVKPKFSRNEMVVGQDVEPQLHFIFSKEILIDNENELLFKRDGVAWLINKFGYFRFREVKDKWVNIDGNDGYYAHSFGVLPIVKAGGLWNSQGYYDSWLDAAKAIAEEYITAKSSEVLAWKESSHPFIEEVSADCPECNGLNKGKVSYCGKCNECADSCDCGELADHHLLNCRSCNGHGYISHNPGQRYLRPAEDMANPAVRIVAPSIEIPVKHSENCELLYNQILKALHLTYIESAQSGIAKDKDMETRYQFLSKISNDIFDRVIYDLLYFITGLRNVKTVANGYLPSPVKADINKPTQFKIKTTADLLAEYKESNEANLPAFILSRQAYDYVDKQYGGDEVMKRKVLFILEADKVAVETDEQVNTMLLSNIITQNDAKYHNQLPTIIDKVIRERGELWFAKASFNDIEAEVKKVFIPANPEPLNIDNGIDFSV